MQFIKKIGSWIIPIIVGIVTVLLLRQYVVQPVSVSGPSMYPNLENGEKVQLVGFGTFETRERAAREGRNPRTKETINIPASTVPVFKAGKEFKEKVNK